MTPAAPPPLHWFKIGRTDSDLLEGFVVDDPHRTQARQLVATLIQAEHLALLIGSGLPIAAAKLLGGEPVSMEPRPLFGDLNNEICTGAQRFAAQSGRGTPNIEDQLNVALALREGLQLLSDARFRELSESIDEFIGRLSNDVAAAESALSEAFAVHENGPDTLKLIERFLLGFARRSAAGDRLHVFTTNYDRLIEFAADSAGLHMLDNFVGIVHPVFRAPRLSIDIHYNPPGLRGEPRYLEGVMRLTKLHGSIDWRFNGTDVVRLPSSFGLSPVSEGDPAATVLVYPNAVKDLALSAYPYSELFRDFSAAVARPQSALVTFGYGFGDEHINGVLQDMLRVSSTHLLIVSYDDPGHRIRKFVRNAPSTDRVSVLIGSQVGSLNGFVESFSPDLDFHLGSKVASQSVPSREAD